LLCSYAHSITEVCEKLSINRQQFHRYLNGQSRPSHRNLRNICDFFGVDVSTTWAPSARPPSLNV
tara:strand:- start:1537 stop:1731 length:195 start_codon:yes stop_codon:yes gene_type:complete